MLKKMSQLRITGSEMKYTKQNKKNNYTLKVGDIVVIKYILGALKYTIVRVTKKYAIFNFNENSEGKVDRVFDFGFRERPHHKHDNNSYEVWSCEVS